jgi:hypothetical protein
MSRKMNNPWTEDDNLMLHQNFNEFRDDKFRNIAKHLPQRTPREAQARWRLYENTSLDKNQNMTQQQEDLLMNLIKSYGKKWSFLSKYFPGKSQNTLKYTYLRLVKIKTKTQQKSIFKPTTDEITDLDFFVVQDFLEQFQLINFEKNDKTHKTDNKIIDEVKQVNSDFINEDEDFHFDQIFDFDFFM